MHEPVETVIQAMSEQDWDTVRLHLHPYVHWYGPNGEVRGRKNVLEVMRGLTSPEPPSTYELRDGQIYRWRCA